eukprot:CAMPEP_0174971872 /NCGR_PEP_ID=MMETSP0004_2-20121128/10280_1 /TAXON_ID=420556 /ORGANISM="Ochromonas sp., Strain CCMP1393" /LENGTH=424 /DNA_ID=CAMNT_0016221963 /DNA_START=88 /DNA_END=1362 /DNA_ORIENTATION=+
MRRKNYDTSFLERKKKRTDSKKICELGWKCPYLNEYQHQLEFSHDHEPIISTENNFAAFTGASHKLGAINNELLNGLDYSNTASNSSSSSSSSSSNYSNSLSINNWGAADEPIFCDMCSNYIHLSELETHMKSHEMRGDAIRKEQDSEYEKSLLLDLQRKFHDQETKRAAEEKKNTEKALALSLAISKKAEREYALALLQPEPNEDYVGSTVAIKFTLPGTGGRKLRKFRSVDSVQQAFLYVRSLDQMEGLRFDLRSAAVGSAVIRASEDRSFAALALTSNTSLLVAVIEEEEEEEEEGGNKAEVQVGEGEYGKDANSFFDLTADTSNSRRISDATSSSHTRCVQRSISTSNGNSYGNGATDPLCTMLGTRDSVSPTSIAAAAAAAATIALPVPVSVAAAIPAEESLDRTSRKGPGQVEVIDLT